MGNFVVVPEKKYKDEERQVVVRPLEVGQYREDNNYDEQFGQDLSDLHAAFKFRTNIIINYTWFCLDLNSFIYVIEMFYAFNY